MEAALKRFVDARMMDRRIPSQRELAKRAGVNENYLSNVLRGGRPMGAKLRLQLCEVLDIQPVELLNPPGMGDGGAIDWPSIAAFLRQRRGALGLSREDVVDHMGHRISATYLGLLEDGLGTDSEELQESLARGLGFRGITELILSAREHLARESQDEDSLPSSDLSLELNPPYHEVESLLELEPGVQLQTDSIQFIHDKMSELELDIRGLAEKARVRVETLKQLLAGDEHNEILEYRIAGALGVTFEKLWAPDHSTDIEVWSWSDYGNPAAQRSRVNVQDPNISPRTFAVATSRVNGTEELIIVDPDSSWHPGDRVFMYVGGLGPSIGRVRERHGHISVQTMMADRDPRFWDDASWVRDIADRIVGKIIGTARYRVGGLISAIYIFPEVPPREADTWEEYYLARVQDKIARAFNDFDSLFVIMPALKEKPGIREARVALESASQTLAAILAGEGRTLVGSGQVGPHDDDPGAVARG